MLKGTKKRGLRLQFRVMLGQEDRMKMEDLGAMLHISYGEVFRQALGEMHEKIKEEERKIIRAST